MPTCAPPSSRSPCGLAAALAVIAAVVGCTTTESPPTGPSPSHGSPTGDTASALLSHGTLIADAPAPPLVATAQAAVSAKRLAAWHDLVASEPHRAGTVGDENQTEHLAEAFAIMGLEVERHPFWAWLPRPVSASLSIESPVRRELSVREAPLESDPFTFHPGLDIGFNAYSASGEATAEVVYANYGRKQDFERLAELGVSCEGRIVLARYGGNFRGYKAKFAEAAGAAGLVIYTDPKDSGWGQGLSWPEGGFARATSIQRGSILTVPWAGDPLTPGREASEHAERLSPDDIALPSIPVQPVSWDAAQQILGLMRGAEAPDDWQGGLPFRYRLDGGAELRVRLAVEQRGELVRSENVLGTLRGSEQPDQFVVVGGHHDAWCHGADDPTSGLITVLEAARAFATAAQDGQRPRRSIVFAGWGAEEYGLVGSTEWVESREQQLREHAVAYLNLDATVNGPRFGASASPSLQSVIAAAAAGVPSAPDTTDAAGDRAAEDVDTDEGTRADAHAPSSATVPGDDPAVPDVLTGWLARGEQPDAPGLPRMGDLGGGSDFVAFLARAAVPSAGLSSGGAKGTAYHSIDDTLTWYRATVGDDYEPARMVTRMIVGVAGRLADAPLLPLDPSRVGPETLRHLRSLSTLALEAGVVPAWRDDDASSAGDLADIAPALRAVASAALRDADRCARVLASLYAAERAGHLDAGARAQVDAALLALDRAFLDDHGLPDRAWYCNLFAAPDEDSGYASAMLPGLRAAIERRDGELLALQAQRLVAVFSRRAATLGTLESLPR